MYVAFVTIFEDNKCVKEMHHIHKNITNIIFEVPLPSRCYLY